MENEIKLKPCPFCGGKAEAHSGSGVTFIVECKHCDCVAPNGAKTEAVAAKIWNQRAEISCEKLRELQEKAAKFDKIQSYVENENRHKGNFLAIGQWIYDFVNK